MIDLTKYVSPTVLAETAIKLEAEQIQRDEAEAKKDLEEALTPYELRLVRHIHAVSIELLSALLLKLHCLRSSMKLLDAQPGLHLK